MRSFVLFELLMATIVIFTDIFLTDLNPQARFYSAENHLCILTLLYKET